MKKEQQKDFKNIISQDLLSYSAMTVSENISKLNSHSDGLSDEEVDNSRSENGSNIMRKSKGISVSKRIADAFFNPFALILIALATVSLITDVIIPDTKDPSTMIVILIMVIISGALRFIEETKANRESLAISKLASNTTRVKRNGSSLEIPIDEVVVGDIVVLGTGDMIPADCRVLFGKDLFVSQASLTGESEPIEKLMDDSSFEKSPLQRKNLLFLGSDVVSGSGSAIVLNVGDDTMFGGISKGLSGKAPKTSFEKGVDNVSYLLIIFMLIMVPLVFIINGLTKKDWWSAFFFAISIAVGLTPEMLPMIVSTCLSKGANVMSKHKVIIKNLSSIEDLGSIDVLCTDKTGTLTENRVIVEKHLDISGKEDARVLRHAFLNSYFQTGFHNLIDNAIIQKEKEIAGEREYTEIIANFQKVDEIPFDFVRRRLSVMVIDRMGKRQIITKGALEEMMSISSFVEIGGDVVPLTDELKNMARREAVKLAQKGMRIIAVSQKNNPPLEGLLTAKDENDMVMIGFLAFLDETKKSAPLAIKALKEHGIATKVLTGDSDLVTKMICECVGIDDHFILLGEDVEEMNDETLKNKVEQTTIFARLSPEQKARVVRILKENGHHVGYMGDGVNDALALKEADVGISVDTAIDIAKESADVILLEKDLLVLENGVEEGRRTYTNMLKYIKLTISSSFGNMLSVLMASAFLPFLPMLPIQILFLNLLYDISCISLPWDKVDDKYLLTPASWNEKSLISFMLIFGPISSLFDIGTYLLMFFFICPKQIGSGFNALTAQTAIESFISLFQTGWFIESMWTQTLVIYMLRTEKIPFVQSVPSRQLLFLTISGILIATIVPYTFINSYLGLSSVPYYYFGFLLLIITLYLSILMIVKKYYIKKFHKLL